MTAQQLILREYRRSKNFMTPKIIEYGWIKEEKIAYELSEGQGIRMWIYGVSVVMLNDDKTTKRLTDEKGCHPSLKEAEEYIEQLREKFKRV